MRLPMSAQRIFAVLCASMLIASAGCGGPKIIPVSGIATVDGKPLSGFLIAYDPQFEARMDCAGRTGSDGRYSLRMDDGFKQYKGVPPGKYKVTISSPEDLPIPVNKKFLDLRKTELVIDVVENAPPGAYDLKFTK